MAHKTLIGGTAYEISGGKTLVNGTAYSIDKGKTLVGGTAYEVGFGPAMVTITITGSGTDVACLEINGEWYYESATIEVPVGTIVHCYTSVESASDREKAFLRINGVYTWHDEYDGIYPGYVVVGNATIECGYSYGKDKYGYIDITEL